MSNIQLSRFLVTASLLLVLGNRARAQTYSPTVLGILGNGPGISFAYGINDSGEVVGGADSESDAHLLFRWTTQTGMQNVGQLVSSYSCYGNGINASGEACGVGNTQSNGFACAIRIVNHTIIALSRPGGDSYGRGIADNGTVVGWGNFSNGCGGPECAGNPGHAMKWVGSAVTLLPELGGFFSVATDISPDGNLVCGYAATPGGQTVGFRLQLASGTITALPPLAGDSAAYALGVNTQGDVVGYSQSLSGNPRAVLWSGTTPILLGVPANATGSSASAISESGAIIGWSNVGQRTHGLRFSRNGPPVDLNDVMTPLAGWTCEYAASINSAGDIVGYAFDGTHLRGIVLHACRGDFNGDSALDFFDYLDFVDAFASMNPGADFNGDGTIDFFDYLDFVDAFSSGC